MRTARALASLALASLAALALAGCGPRNKPGDRLLGIDSASNSRSAVSSSGPAHSP